MRSPPGRALAPDPAVEPGRPVAAAGGGRIPARPATPRFLVMWILATLSVASLGFTFLWIAGALGKAATGIAVAAIGIAAWERRPRLPSRIWVLVQVAFLLWLGWGWAFGGRHVLSSFGDLLVFVQVHRLLTLRTSRDHLYVCFIAFGQLLLASILTLAAGWFVAFVVLLLALAWALLLTRLARSVEQDWLRSHGGREVPAAAWAGLGPLLRWPFVSSVSALVLGMLPATLALFFVLPRIQAGFLSGSLLPPIAMSGFSEQVRLGEIGVIQLSDAPVMRVRLQDPEGRPASAAGAHWRGLAMDHFDGRTWSLCDKRRSRLGWVGGARSHGPPRSQPWSLRQEITLEPLDSRVLFFLARPTGIYGGFRSLEAAQTDGFYMPGARTRQTYVVYSEPPAADPASLRASDPRASPEAVLIPGTQLPAGLDPRIAALATEWTRGGASALDEALLVQQRLRDGFTYSLEQPASAARDPLAAFLFDVREGHCEYFATAMAVLLRTRGIPARIVNGLLGGEWNPAGGYWLLRQRDAHSWVEVHFPGIGWVTFDPTPGGGGVRGLARIRAWSRLLLWADWGRVQWTQVMLDFGLDRQAEGLRRTLAWITGDRGYSLLRLALDGSGASEERPAGQGRGAPVVGTLLLLLLAWAALPRAAAWARSRRSGGRGLPSRVRRLARLADLLQRRWEARLGPVPAPARETLLSWAGRVDRLRPGFPPASPAVRSYLAVRFGGQPPPEDLERSLRSHLRAARRLPRGRSGQRSPPGG